MKRHLFHVTLLAAVASSAAFGQITCTPGSPAANKLVCEFPFASGALTNAGALGSGYEKNAFSTASAQAAAINSALAAQLGQLPLATASAGTVTAYRNGVPELFNNLGPILVDRAQTIGKNKAYLGVSASQYVFTEVNGHSIRALPFGYTLPYQNGTIYTQENVQGSFVVDQLVSVFTYGLSNRAEMSFIVPVMRVSLSASVPSTTEYNVINGSTSAPIESTGASHYAHGTASGAGDGEAAIKYVVYPGERSAVTAGAIFRAPTGVAENLIGSGAWGFNPYIIYSYLGRVSPHLKMGYQWNTKTVLNNPTGTPGGNLALPGGVTYDAGADWAISRHFTAAADMLGYQFVNAQKLIIESVTVPNTQNKTTIQTATTTNSSYSVNNISTGIKWNPGGAVVFSANLLTQINNDGLHARPTPLIGVAYKF